MIPFTKMHGIGNDFVMIDAIEQPLDEDSIPSLAAAMCDRRFGVGSDGLILALRGSEAAFRMRMFNPDGTESEMCGNGVRCIAKFLIDQGHAQGSTIPVQTGAGVLDLEIQPNAEVRVDMGPARLTRSDFGMAGSPGERFVEQPLEALGQRLLGTGVSMGNPHVVFFVEDVDAVPLAEWGPAFETHPAFPKKTNVHFVAAVDRTHLRQRTWERGAGVTLACGTGACAAAVAGYLTGRSDRSVEISLPGGRLRIAYGEDGTVWMTGPAETVFSGEWPD